MKTVARIHHIQKRNFEMRYELISAEKYKVL